MDQDLPVFATNHLGRPVAGARLRLAYWPGNGKHCDMTTRAAIDAAYRSMRAALEQFPPPDEIPMGWEPSLPLNPEHLATCTVTAAYIATQLGGEVWGYQHDENPSAILGALEFGHDFALIDGRFIVDWWATEYGSGVSDHPGVLDLAVPADTARAQRWYGPRDHWMRTVPTTADMCYQQGRHERSLPAWSRG